MIKDPLHHRANAAGYVREHIVVMEALILWPVELPAEVHHRNGKRGDNEPENLVYFDRHADHMREHFPKGQPVCINRFNAHIYGNSK